MTVTLNPPEHLGGNSYRYTWDSNLVGPTYYVYADGKLAGVTTAEAWVVYVDSGASLFFEVLDDAEAEPSAVYSGYRFLCWYPATDLSVASYVVEEYTGGAWVERRRMLNDGRGFWILRTSWLDDETRYTFRVRALGDNGNLGTAAEFGMLVVRTPDPPGVSYSYDSETRKITVSEA